MIRYSTRSKQYFGIETGCIQGRILQTIFRIMRYLLKTLPMRLWRLMILREGFNPTTTHPHPPPIYGWGGVILVPKYYLQSIFGALGYFFRKMTDNFQNEAGSQPLCGKKIIKICGQRLPLWRWCYRWWWEWWTWRLTWQGGRHGGGNDRLYRTVVTLVSKDTYQRLYWYDWWSKWC